MPKGISLHIGVNEVDPGSYDGSWEGRLRCCVEDARAMSEIAEAMGHDCRVLTNENATIENVKAEIEAAAAALGPGDTFLLSASCHGTQTVTLNYDDDDEDGKDETWALYNGQLLDNELTELWVKFERGVNIIVFSDTCHSGTVALAPTGAGIAFSLTPFNFLSARFEPKLAEALPEFLPDRSSEDEMLQSRLMPVEVSFLTYQRNRDYYDHVRESFVAKKDDIKASLLVFTACADDKLAYERGFHGVFTGRVLDVWAEGDFNGDYSEFFENVRQLMTEYDSQIPTKTTYEPSTILPKQVFVI